MQMVWGESIPRGCSLLQQFDKLFASERYRILIWGLAKCKKMALRSRYLLDKEKKLSAYALKAC
jgi:hypothetical protein